MRSGDNKTIIKSRINKSKNNTKNNKETITQYKKI